MNTPTRGLGRGLQSLLSTPLPAHRVAGGRLPIAAIQPGRVQPRQHLRAESLESLAASIREKGVIQPIIVRPLADRPHQFEIVAGERRWQAAKLAGLTEIPALVRDLSDQEALAVALIENIQREELTPAEEARALKRLASDFGLTHEEVATAVGRSRAAVTNLIRLLELPPEVIAYIDAGTLSMGHARALLGLEDEAACRALAALVVERQLSVRETEARVRRARLPAPPPPTAPVITDILHTASAHLQLQRRDTDRYRIVIDLTDETDCNSLLTEIERLLRKDPR